MLARPSREERPGDVKQADQCQLPGPDRCGKAKIHDIGGQMGLDERHVKPANEKAEEQAKITPVGEGNRQGMAEIARA